MRITKKMMSLLLAVCVAVTMLMVYAPTKAYAADPTGAFTVTGGTYGTDYSYDSGVLTIKTDTAITIKNDDPNTATSDRIVVEKDKDANITLDGVNISASGFNAALQIADNSTGNVNVTLAPNSTNKLQGGQNNGAGLAKGGNNNGVGKLTITGDGNLVANGGYRAPGIGGNYTQDRNTSSTANIQIAGGTVEVNGQFWGAGIGGALGGSASGITISGGNVKVSSGLGAAGIGGGYGTYGTGSNDSNITISGGTVSVTVHSYQQYSGAAIGNGYLGTASDIKVTGGSLKLMGDNGFTAFGAEPKDNDGNEVQLLEIMNPNSQKVTIDGTEWKPSNHAALDNSDTTLYAYLTKGDHSITVGNTTHNYKYVSGQFVLNGTASTNPVTLRINGSTNHWEVSYDDGATWNEVLDDEGQTVTATGETGTTPQLRVSGDGYWQVSYDNGTTWTDVTDASGTRVKATGDKGEAGAQGISISKIEKTKTEDLVDTYTITLSNGSTSTFTVTNGAKGDQGEKGDKGDKGDTGDTGAKGDKGDTGATGATGASGITPKLKIGEDNLWYVSYDNGSTWKSLGVKATGSDGKDGRDGTDGNTPQLKTDESGNLLVSYDDGNTWTSLGAKVMTNDTWAEIQKLQIAVANVRNLKASPKTGKQIKVTWKAPRGISGLKYQVKYQKKGSKKWVTKTTSKKSLTVKKLKKNAEYRFKVRGYKKIVDKTIYTDYDTTSWVKVTK